MSQFVSHLGALEESISRFTEYANMYTRARGLVMLKTLQIYGDREANGEMENGEKRFSREWNTCRVDSCSFSDSLILFFRIFSLGRSFVHFFLRPTVASTSRYCLFFFRSVNGVEADGPFSAEICFPRPFSSFVQLFLYLPTCGFLFVSVLKSVCVYSFLGTKFRTMLLRP